MNKNRLKHVLIIIVVLIIGFAAGYYTASILTLKPSVKIKGTTWYYQAFHPLNKIDEKHYSHPQAVKATQL